MYDFGCSSVPGGERQSTEWHDDWEMPTGRPDAEVVQAGKSFRQHIRILEGEVNNFQKRRLS